MKRRGGIWEWLWKGEKAPGAATVEVVVDCPAGERALRHRLAFADNGGRLQVIAEEIAMDWCLRL